MSPLWVRLKRYIHEARMIPHPGAARGTADRTSGQNTDALPGESLPVADKTDGPVITKTTTYSPKTTTHSTETTTRSTQTTTYSTTTATTTGNTSTKTSLTSGQATTTTAHASTPESEPNPTTTLPGAANGHGSYPSGVSSTDTKIAIAVPIAVVGLLAIVGLVWFFLRRSRQRNARPAFSKAPTQQFPNSTSELKVNPNFVLPDPVVSLQRDVPMANVPHGQTYQPRPASTAVGSPVDSNMERGLAVAMPLNQRMSATQHDSRKVERSDVAVESGAADLRMPLQDHREDGDDVSVVSDLNERNDIEHGFDDLSPVSSFEDEQPGDHQGQISR